MRNVLPISAADFMPRRLTLPSLQEASRACRGCDLYRNATQTVFGEGAKHASVMFVGEQPGDREDREGRPFVGPAGRILARAMDDAGLSRDAAYVTNAVKHFKWEPRGKRRIHKRPTDAEIRACTPWLEAELKLVQPLVVVCLGATAARAAFGKTVRIRDYRGTFTQTPLVGRAFVTVHPSSLIRLEDKDDRDREYARFVADLVRVRIEGLADRV